MASNKSSSRNSRKSSIFSRFSFMDLFGIQPNFTIDGAKTNKTCFGVLFSVLMMVAILGSFLYYFQIYYLQKNPIITSNLTKGLNNTLDLSSDAFFLSIYVRDDGNIVPLSSYEKTLFRTEVKYIKVE